MVRNANVKHAIRFFWKDYIGRVTHLLEQAMVMTGWKMGRTSAVLSFVLISAVTLGCERSSVDS